MSAIYPAAETLERDQSLSNVEDAHKALHGLVVNCNDLRTLERLLGRFNIFRVLGFEEGELRHSNVLAWLFQPRESHGLGDLFLRRFLMRVVNESSSLPEDTLSPVDLDAAEIREVEVQREWQNIDLLIRIRTAEDPWTVVIENKVNSAQHSNQLRKYRSIIEDGHSQRSEKRMFILLSKSGEEPEDDAYLTATYAQVYDIVKQCIGEKEGVIGSEPETLLNNYLTLLEERFMEDSEIARLAASIYKSHKLALDLILEHRPDALMALTDSVRVSLEQVAESKKLIPLATSKGFVRFIPEAWNIPDNLDSPNGKGWAFVMCELYLWGNFPVFKIFTGLVPNEKWMDNLWELSKKPPFTQHVKRTKKPAKWMSVYSKKAKLRMDDLLASDIDQATEKIGNWLKEQIEEPDFKEAVKVLKGMIPDIRVSS